MSAGTGTVLEEETRSKTRHAPRWRVLLHDDPVTPFDFVVGILRKVFGKSPARALRLTQEAQDSGVALVAVLAFEQAELRCEQVRSLARARGYPLSVTMEPED